MPKKQQISPGLIVGAVVAVLVIVTGAVFSGLIEAALGAWRAYQRTTRDRTEQEAKTERTGIIGKVVDGLIAGFTGGAKAAIGAV